MPTSCCIKGCTNRHTKGCNLGFFRLPTETPRRNTWLNIIGDKVTNPSDSSRICGTHFSSGRPSQDPDNVDFVPTVFASSSGDPNAILQPRHHLQCRVHGTGRFQSVTSDNVEEHPKSSSSTYLHYIHRRELETQEQNSLNNHQQSRLVKRIRSYDEPENSSAWDGQQQSNGLKRTSSYDGQLDDLYSRGISVRKVNNFRGIEHHQTNSYYDDHNSRHEEVIINGVFNQETRIPHSTISDTGNLQKSRLFFPRANGSDIPIIKKEKIYDTKEEVCSTMSSSRNNHMAIMNSMNSHEDVFSNNIHNNRHIVSSDIYMQDGKNQQRNQVVEENITLKQRINSLDRIVSELKNQLTEQQHYINRLQTFAERRQTISPTSFRTRLSPVDDDLFSNPQSSSSSTDSYKSGGS